MIGQKSKIISSTIATIGIDKIQTQVLMNNAREIVEYLQQISESGLNPWKLLGGGDAH